MKKYAVVILNWNGAQDTIDCIESIFNTDSDAVPLVVDNGSSDDSCEVIIEYLKNKNKNYAEGDFESLRKMDIVKYDFILLRNYHNKGFSGGCNSGLRLISGHFEKCIMLNNDTVVEENSLPLLIDKLNSDKNIFASIPLLTVFNTGRIWNCGGRISRLGYRKYYYSNSEIDGIKISKEIPCTFFTGCCFAVRVNEFMARGGFTERFFFGEEDFELSLWMLDKGKKAVCITDAVVHHKVSASISKASSISSSSKVFVHYLNRLIHMRLRFGNSLWIFWLGIYLPYVFFILLKNNILNIGNSRKFFTDLLKESYRKDCVTGDDFRDILKRKY